MGDDVRISLRDAIEKTGDASEVRTAYTNLGLSHYARKRFDCAIQCFEDQIRHVQDTRPDGDYDEKELEVLGFAYRLLSQLYGEVGDEEQALGYSQRCKEVEVDICLQGLAMSINAGDGLLSAGKVPALTALRDQLLLNTEELGPILLQSPKFPAVLNAMINGGYEVAQQVLQVLLLLLAQPLPRVQKKRLRQVLVAVRSVLCTITQGDQYSKAESKLLKMSFVVLRFLVQWIPSSFDCVPLQEIDRFIRRHVPSNSTLFSHWSQLLLEITTKSKVKAESSSTTGSGTHQPIPVNSIRSPTHHQSHPSPSSTSSSTSDRGAKRSPSFLTDTSTYSSSETDTLTFISLPSDDEDLPDHHFQVTAP